MNKLVVFKFNEETNEEERMPGIFNSDREFWATCTEPGDYIFYPLHRVETPGQLKKLKGV
jgi:hypothetical protein